MNRRTKTAQFRGYAVANVTESVKAQVKKDRLSKAAAWDFICDCAVEGYKVSVRFFDARSAYQVMLYGADPDSANAGLVLSLWHVDPLIALTAIKVLHEDVYQEGWALSESLDW